MRLVLIYGLLLLSIRPGSTSTVASRQLSCAKTDLVSRHILLFVSPPILISLRMAMLDAPFAPRAHPSVKDFHVECSLSDGDCILNILNSS